MRTVALVAEGITDVTVLESVIKGMYGCEVIVKPLMPIRDETGKVTVECSSNWFKVLEYCRSDELKDALSYCDSLIIQIDTDVSEETHFAVSHFDNDGVELSVSELVEAVKIFIQDLIGEEFVSSNPKSFVFAICVHSIECWLLPLYFTGVQASKTKNCLRKLNEALPKKYNFSIDENSKDDYYYQILAKELRKPASFKQCLKYSESMGLFINELVQALPV